MLFEDIKYRLRCGKCGRKDFGMIRNPHHATSGSRR